LAVGKKLFALLAGESSPWIIKTIKASLGKLPPLPKANLVTTVNVFNELFWKIPQTDRRAITAFTEKNARSLTALAGPAAAVFVAEPGVPRCGEFICLLRDIFADSGRPPLSPCPHSNPCPFPGGNKAKWCHFVCDTDDAPAALLKLSAAAGFPKERAALSFLLTGPVDGGKTPEEQVPGERQPKGERPPAGVFTGRRVPVRIVSDAFPLPGGNFGRYGCSERGLVLVRGKKPKIDALVSGTLTEPDFKEPPEQDPKSGALVAEAGR
jgi:hypothetical protein